MKSNASSFISCQHMAALMLYKFGYFLPHLFLHLSWWQVSGSRDCVAVVCEMIACTEHSSAHFKQSVLIEFILLIESVQLEFTVKCRLFMVMTVLIQALCAAGTNREELICVINDEVDDM